MNATKDAYPLLLTLNFLLASLLGFVFSRIWNIDTSVYLSTAYCIFWGAHFSKRNGSHFSPVSIFIGFYWLMLVGRPLLYEMNLSEEDLITASSYREDIIPFVNFYICISIICLGLVFFFIDAIVTEGVKKLKIPSVDVGALKYLFPLAFVVSGLFMLRDGLHGYAALAENNYLTLIETGEIHFFNQIAYSVLKWSWFFVIVLFPHRIRISCFLFLIFLSALPMAGLRGYFVIYFLMVLSILEGIKSIRVNILGLFAFLFLLLSGMTLLLEYRLGFSVATSGLFSPFFNALFAQGATYEVLYGTVEHNKDISFFQNVMFPSLFNNPSFGNYIDKLRGVASTSDDIGFATSAFAEILTGGVLVWGLYLVVLSTSLSVLDFAFRSVKKSSSLFIIFFLAPVVWSQPRGASTQLLVKLLIMILLFLLFYVLRGKK